MKMEDSKGLEGFFKIPKGSKRQYEYCVDHKSKNEIKLKPHGHQMIKNETGKLKRIKKIF